MGIKATEQQVHNSICEYIRKKYPDVIFTSESSGLKLPIGLAKQIKNQRSSKGLPDLFILKPNRTHYGLILEVKASTLHLFNKNGYIRSTSHIKEQMEILKRLNDLGYFSCFVCGIDEAIWCIDGYMADL